MQAELPVSILPQPNDTTCGPTSLHAVYRYYGMEISLEDVISGVTALEGGGTLGVFLGLHALKQGFTAEITTYNLHVFDPTWFSHSGEALPGIRNKLVAQASFKQDAKLSRATEGYLEFLDMGGRVAFRDPSSELIHRYLDAGRPLLTGLSATYLYRTARECGEHTTVYDDIRGEPSGHFVVMTGYSHSRKQVLIADPYRSSPLGGSYYAVHVNRLIHAILLGIVTYDANILVIKPKQETGKENHAHSDSRQ